ncbi:hypothetical protein CAPTEDRAFT_163996 [Capitella teleta]|uniref:Peroxisomal membrane protein PEX13 n=1 Tax=Capitella teleta TaxID=283909 RepID=R7UMI8_CAPTE|nr:hypothetical protein CAPTEDRAFT_162542 [Capitella teleta]ELU13106.1 hypothetical protein CAPTEDRAFT_163996 [Capitella teleta]|eukprot:ELU04457.1 hypothetical protein CAPTEDRAFT_162542 [Capitella teleta]
MYGAGGYGSSMGMGYGGGMYGGGMGYGSSMGYGGGMYGGMNRYGGGAYGMQQDSPNTFVQQAEDSSRQAFQSIESIVQAFGSVSMMLESTFYAVYNSFRAVIGVADQFTRMRMHFAQIFSAFAVIRSLRWLYRKLLVLLRLRQAGLPEDAWNQAAQASLASLAEGEVKGGRSSWPILMFFAITLGGPWLIWRILKSMGGGPTESAAEWASGLDDHFVARADYDFQGNTDEELSFRRGQKIIVAPKDLQPRVRGWILGSVDGQRKGLVPANYVKVLGKKRGKRHAGQEEAAWAASSSSVASSQDLEASFPPVEAGSSKLSEVFDQESASNILSAVDEEICSKKAESSS